MKQPTQVIRNWEGRVVTRPQVVIRPQTVDELKAIVRDRRRFPSPVRPIGAMHSSTRCAAADNGTLVDMTGLNTILETGKEFVRVQAGISVFDLARELERRGLQFFINPGLGNMTLGSAACGATLYASLPGQKAQFSSYVTSMRVVTPSGATLEVGEDRPDLLRMLRSSYGMLGIVYELTVRVRPLADLQVSYEDFDLRGFCESLPRLVHREQGMKLYVFPFRQRVTAEYSGYTSFGGKPRSLIWRLHNWTRRTLQPAVDHCLAKGVPIRQLRDSAIDGFNQALSTGFARALSGASASPTSQILHWPPKARSARVRYSAWVFPESAFQRVLWDYAQFCRDHYAYHGFRCNLPTVVNRLTEDADSLFSASLTGPAFSLEPMSTTDEGWEDFLVGFNEFCSQRNGIPLFNQTWGLSLDQVQRAFGQRARIFWKLRTRADQHDRFLNNFFTQLLAQDGVVY